MAKSPFITVELHESFRGFRSRGLSALASIGAARRGPGEAALVVLGDGAASAVTGVGGSGTVNLHQLWVDG